MMQDDDDIMADVVHFGMGAAHGVSDKPSKKKQRPIGFVHFKEQKPEKKKPVKRQRRRTR